MTDNTSSMENMFESARLAAEKRGADIVLLDVSGKTDFTDYFLLVSAGSDRRVRTIAEAIRMGMKERGVTLIGSEGLKEGKWGVLDFGSFVVHIFYEELRRVFDLEGLWSEGRRVELPAYVFDAAKNAREKA